MSREAQIRQFRGPKPFLQTFLEIAKLEVRSHLDGAGQPCLAVHADSVGALLGDLFEVMADCDAQRVLAFGSAEIAEAMRGIEYDAIGSIMVVYWPGVSMV